MSAGSKEREYKHLLADERANSYVFSWFLKISTVQRARFSTAVVTLICGTIHQVIASPVPAASKSDRQASSAQTSKFSNSKTEDEAILARARQNRKMFEDEEAIKDYTAYLKSHPENDTVRAERADELRNEHRFEEYISDLQILIKSRQRSIACEAASQLGKFYQKKHQYSEAIKAFKLARSLGSRTQLTEMCDCARLSGDYETALKISNDIINSGENFAGRLRRAQTLIAWNKPREALSDLNSLIAEQKKYIDSIDKESRAIFPALKRLMQALTERANCFDALKEAKLAKQDRSEIRKIEQEAYNESPFLTK